MNSKMKKQDAKILILSSDPWRDQGGDNTSQQLFSDCPKENLYSLYFSPEMPDTKSCGKIFRINEIGFPKKLLSPPFQVGRELAKEEFLNPRSVAGYAQNPKKKLFKKLSQNSFVSFFLNCARECAWALCLWKEHSLKRFLKENPVDVIFFPVSKWAFQSLVVKWILKQCGARLILFFVDDSFTYKSVPPYYYWKQFLFRRLQLNLVRRASQVFVISPKMKREYDAAFCRETVLLTKPIESVPEDAGTGALENSDAMTFLYAGNLLYGRDRILLKIAEALRDYNKTHGTAHRLKIYSRDPLTPQVLHAFRAAGRACELCAAVPYSELQTIIKKSCDVLVFPESFEKKEKRKTWLSFSTKITDYFKSGKLIWAVGPRDVSSIEYLEENDCAFVSGDLPSISQTLEEIISGRSEHAKKIENMKSVARQFHSREKILDSLNTAFGD